MGVPNNFILEPSVQVLSHLRDINIKTFPTDLDDAYTPSTHSSSLQTPIKEESIGLPEHSVQVTVSTSNPLGLTFPPEDEAPSPPSAPLIKDYDSFTEGTGKGSFESLPLDGGGMMEDSSMIPLTPEGLAEFSGYTEESLRTAIETWREGVSNSTEEGVAPVAVPTSSAPSATTTGMLSSTSLPVMTHTKRPRSNGSCCDEEQDKVKRTKVFIRPRAQSLTSVSSTVNSFAWEMVLRPFGVG